ncbi:hypothetical protein [Pendulispora albinea]|uniref:Uncharacterized protein n=1 Tax=Pendulispora albinea TaxID=2741071 RepID=A0ABZ2MB45_9BACT
MQSRFRIALKLLIVAGALVALGGIASLFVILRGYGQCNDEVVPPPPRPVSRAVPGGGVQALMLAGDTSCASMKDGSVWCWGDESPLAASLDGSNSEFGASAAAKTVALGAMGYGCELDVAGHARCWSSQKEGVVREPVARPPREASFVRVVAGSNRGCGLDAAGHVTCWDANGHFQRPRLDGATSLAIGSSFVCASMRDKMMICDRLASNEDDRPSPQSPMDHCRELAVTDSGSCCLDEQGQIFCESSTRPRAKIPLEPMVSLAGGGADGTCALTRAGDIWCWDIGPFGAWGGAPKHVSTVPGAARLALWDFAGCVQTESGQIQCWGNDILPNSTARASSSDVPRPLAGITDARDLAVGSDQVCFRSAASGWRCFSRHASTAASERAVRIPIQILDARPAHRFAFGKFASCNISGEGAAHCSKGAGLAVATAPIDLDQTVQIVVGEHHACAVRSSGQLWCWGANESKQIRDAPDAVVEKPIPSAGSLGSVKSVALGSAFTCALTEGQPVHCWGDNQVSELAGTESALQIAAGNGHACVLLDGGRVRCWGSNEHGQLGDGTTARHPLAVDVLGMDGPVQQIVAAGDRTCALATSGRVFCWGTTMYCGGAARCSKKAQSRAERVPDLEDAVEVATGTLHTCARLRNGAVACWGSNEMHAISAGVPLVEEKNPLGHGCYRTESVEPAGTDKPVPVIW